MRAYRKWAMSAVMGFSTSFGVNELYAADPSLTVVKKGATPAPVSENGKVFDLEVVRERYPDRTVKVERHVTQDGNLNYLNHGPWTMWDNSGTMMARGEFWQGKRHGEWKRWHLESELQHPENLPGGAAVAKEDLLNSDEFKAFKRPLLSTATFVEDKLVGSWNVVDADGKMLFSIELDRDIPQGKAIWYHVDGSKRREIDFKAGVVHGHWREWDSTGNASRDDHYIDGRREAVATTSFDNGEKSSEGTHLYAKENVKVGFDWWAGQVKLAVTGTEGKTIKQGKWQYWYEDGGKRCEAEYIDDKPVGRHTWWYRNGQKESEGEFVDGLAQGTWMYWHETGLKAAQGDYFNGQKMGRWVRWDLDGKVVENKDHGSPDVRALQQAQQVPQGQPFSPYGTPTPAPAQDGMLQPIPEPITRVDGVQPPPGAVIVEPGQVIHQTVPPHMGPQMMQPRMQPGKQKGGLFWKR